MPIDTNSQEFQLLLRQFERGNVVLFAGAGFSLGAKNQRGNDPPDAKTLARMLAEKCGWQHQDEELPIVYSQAKAHLGSEALWGFLEELYKDCTPTPWQQSISDLFWYRIFTTNIDDVVETIYRRNGAQRLDPITCPAPFQEQDQFYERVQCVHLHGCVLDRSKDLTFTLEDLADQTAKPSPWYQTLVANMLGKSFVFVGSRLSEPPFYHYLRLRSERERGARESRAKAFLVSPGLTAIYRRQFEQQNFVVVDATAEEFFNILVPQVTARVPSRSDLLKNRYPHQIAAINQGAFDNQSAVLRQFELVAGEAQNIDRANRSYFYDGAEPTWADIRTGVDAEREVSQQFLQALTDDTEGIKVFALVGQAGAGKSTTSKRLAFELFRDGRAVYFTNSRQNLRIGPLLDLINGLGNNHVFIFLDDARSHVNAIASLIRELPGNASVTFVLVDRTHILLPKLQRARLKTTTLEMPGLVKIDCENIIAKLEQTGLLGALQGMSKHDQLREFLGRSRKQLLVAMKEATSGRGFDVIIEDEYRTLVSDNARLAYAITCLAYVHGAPVRRRHVVACLDGSDVEKANTLENDLNGVIISWGNSDHFFAPRHRVIADHVITGPVTVGVREQAVKRYLAQISSDITPATMRLRTAEFTAYKGIINFDSMQDLFGPDYGVIDGIYNELKAYYGDDYLFWLQYGRAEVYFDNFSVAENYLNQSLGIRQNYQAQHYMGVLYLKRALYRENDNEAAADVKKGEEILRQQIRERGDSDPYPYAALVTHKFRYLKVYGSLNLEGELEELKELAETAVRKHPRHGPLTDAYEEVFRAYLSLAIPDNSAPAAFEDDDSLDAGSEC